VGFGGEVGFPELVGPAVAFGEVGFDGTNTRAQWGE
jgi:hypothetical protein